MSSGTTTFLKVDGERRKLRVESTEYAIATGDCPRCGNKELRVQGTGAHPSTDDRAYEADAVAMCCKQRVGTIRAEVPTLFGVEEDERVLGGPWRVY